MLRTQAADDLAVLDWIYRQEHDADMWREPYLRDQEMLMSFYMNYRSQPLPRGLEWMSGDLLPDAFLLIESLLPNVAAGVFGGKSISVNAYTVAGTEVNKALDKALYRMRRRAEFEKCSMPAIRMAGVLGHVFQQNIWVTEWGEKMFPLFSQPEQNAYGERLPSKIVDYEIRPVKAYNGPKTFYPDNAKVWKTPATDQLGRPLAWILEIERDMDYMKQVNDEYLAVTGEPFYRNLEHLANEHRTTLARDRTSVSNAGFNLSARRRTATEYASELGRVTNDGSNSIIMRQAWVNVPKHIRNYRDQSQRRLIIYTPDGLILRDVEMPSYNMYAPMRDIKFMQVANEGFGRTPLYWALPEIEQRSEMRNLRLAEAWLNIMQVRVANRNANFDHNDFVNQPGSVWFFDHDTMRPQDAISVLPRQPVLPEVHREDALMEDHINRTFGSTPNMQGEGLGSRATAFEASKVDQRAGGRADLISRQLAWQLELGAAEDYLGMFAAFGEEPIEVQIDGEEASFPVEVFSEDIDFQYDIEINAGEYGIMNGDQLQTMNQLLGAALANPEVMQFDVDGRKILSSIQHRSGMDNILRPEPEAQMMRQQAMMAQLAAAQADQQPRS